MRNAFQLIESANRHAENTGNTKVHPRGHKPTESQTDIAREKPQLVTEGLQEHDKVAL